MRILLAPMEGLLDCVLRDTLTRVGGIDHCVSEFVRVSGSVLPKRTYQRIVPELENGSKTSAGVPVRVQLLGSDPHFMALNASRLASMQPDGIDLNFGCPAKTVNRHGGGSILLREPDRIFELVAAVRAAMPATMILTAKMRLGYEDKSLALDCARAMQAGGAAEIVVHARTKVEGYKPPAHWEWIGRIQDAVTIPVVANGEIWTVADYLRCREVSGVDDVMLGRGMVANPALARMIKLGEDQTLPWSEIVALMQVFWQLVERHTLPKYHCGRLKQWLTFLRETYPEADVAFQRYRVINDPVEMADKIRDGLC